MKTACEVQCGQCPFRRTCLPSYLGSYTYGSLLNSLWKGFPFFCHTKINYESPTWEARAQRNGKICLGSLVFSKKMMAPIREVTDEELKAARLANENRTDVDCMEPREFMDWHNPENVDKNMALFKQRVKSTS